MSKFEHVAYATRTYTSPAVPPLESGIVFQRPSIRTAEFRQSSWKSFAHAGQKSVILAFMLDQEARSGLTTFT